jgi:hypothetical protein
MPIIIVKSIEKSKAEEAIHAGLLVAGASKNPLVRGRPPSCKSDLPEPNSILAPIARSKSK